MAMITASGVAASGSLLPFGSHTKVNRLASTRTALDAVSRLALAPGVLASHVLGRSEGSAGRAQHVCY